MDHFNGERLKKARIYRGMTVSELAEKVGCKRQTLSMYEIAKSQPTDENLVNNISHALNFPKKFFYQDFGSNTNGTVYFRSLLTTNKKYRNEQIIKIEIIAQVFSLLSDYIEFPEFQPLNLYDDCTPEECALAVRRAWNLGDRPIDNLVSIVENHGILVTSFQTSTNDVDAFSRFVETAETPPTYIIAYSNNKTSASRIHFDIAHELGHIYMHDWSDDIEDLSKEEFKAREIQANEFAAAFLLPESSFRNDAERGPQTIAYYKQLKKKWKVSIAAMIRRSEKLGIISKEEYQTLIRIMQRRGQRKEEPLDDILMTASPSLLKTSIMMLLQEGVFSPREFMDELSEMYGLCINPEEIEYLFDLPSGTLAPNKIIEFNNLQIRANKSTT